MSIKHDNQLRVDQQITGLVNINIKQIISYTQTKKIDYTYKYFCTRDI